MKALRCLLDSCISVVVTGTFSVSTSMSLLSALPTATRGELRRLEQPSKQDSRPAAARAAAGEEPAVIQVLAGGPSLAHGMTVTLTRLAWRSSRADEVEEMLRHAIAAASEQIDDPFCRRSCMVGSGPSRCDRAHRWCTSCIVFARG